MSSPNIDRGPTARNAVPSASMKRAMAAMARYPLHVVKPARLSRVCLACELCDLCAEIDADCAARLAEIGARP